MSILDRRLGGHLLSPDRWSGGAVCQRHPFLAQMPRTRIRPVLHEIDSMVNRWVKFLLGIGCWCVPSTTRGGRVMLVELWRAIRIFTATIRACLRHKDARFDPTMLLSHMSLQNRWCTWISPRRRPFPSRSLSSLFSVPCSAPACDDYARWSRRHPRIYIVEAGGVSISLVTWYIYENLGWLQRPCVQRTRNSG